MSNLETRLIRKFWEELSNECLIRSVKKLNFKRMMKNSKAISPIFATLILIAIAVIAGVVVYMFTSGTLATMTAGGTAGQEKITVQAASIAGVKNAALNNPYTVTVYLEQTGGPAATVNGLIIKDPTGNTITVISVSQALTLGSLTTITGSYSVPTGGSSLVGNSYTVTVTTAAGGSFVASSVTATAS
jgi:flagellin-like protein